MRKLLPSLLVMLLCSLMLLAAAASAHALGLPGAAPAALAGAAGEEGLESDDEAEEGSEPDEEGEDETEACEPEEGESCEDEAEPQRIEKAKQPDRSGACPLKGARAALTLNPGRHRLRLGVHYRALAPTAVSVDTTLHGDAGAVHLATAHARFRRAGVYRDTFGLSERKMKRALAAAEATVELHVAGAPASCSVELRAKLPGAR